MDLQRDRIIERGVIDTASQEIVAVREIGEELVRSIAHRDMADDAKYVVIVTKET